MNEIFLHLQEILESMSFFENVVFLICGFLLINICICFLMCVSVPCPEKEERKEV